jgi:hypothetical protein
MRKHMKTINTAFNIGYARAVSNYNNAVAKHDNPEYPDEKNSAVVKMPISKLGQYICVNKSEIARAAYSRIISDYNNNRRS